MKKIITAFVLSFATTYCYGQDTLSSLPNSISEVAAIVRGNGTIDYGYLNLKSNPISEKNPNLVLTTILFAETDLAKKYVDVTAGIGGGYRKESFSVGALIGWANKNKMLSITAYAYGESKDRTLSGFIFLTKEEDHIVYVFEVLKCFNIRKDMKLGLGLVNFKEYLGLNFRLSIGDNYFGIAPSLLCLPTINLRSTTAEGAEHGSGKLPLFGVQLTFGKESSNRCSSPDCKTP